ncbi:hypothetical protein [Bacteroides cellulosilyticus]|uniref:hypothetical protein n=1 Tax=Bacteroides cellulosilyticus TaxID=246787 RepID=UPI001C37782C|nr:hypothetical protein [Bacteroides cellulosilyticus]MBV3636374.1 hypothetical protein [Bacteroides cellulosilyticus]MBV3662612.1 hypothetical protein [Bacteroides cellulosilyticus]MBV3684672.1 hypothetical protein [Bacteroides cellulosilyticus]MBV3693376.1 hypothetical protein [Bacteroides cellulosilyticus]MBV3706924.1 hypothetical protein [Bacteroides cellulosilyticus]
MIVHLFNANKAHLVLDFVEHFLISIDKKQRFIFYGNDDTPWEKYRALMKEYDHLDYFFCFSYRELIKDNILDKRDVIILHGVDYLWILNFAFSKFKEKYFVCWGSGAKIHKNIRSKAASLVKILIYNRYKAIITLMDEDKETIKKDFYVKNVMTIPYAGKISRILKSQSYDSSYHCKPVVYLGNNSHHIASYLDLIEKLKPLSGKVEVHCMLNYSLKRGKVFDLLVKRGRSIFGDDFMLDTELYSLEDYPSYMNKCDIYLCDVAEQTGLGAIAVLLYLGKKIYLTGKNLHWAKNIGYKVYDIAELSYDSFCFPLSLKDREYNRRLYSDRINKNQKMWKLFLDKLDIE